MKYNLMVFLAVAVLSGCAAHSISPEHSLVFSKVEDSTIFYRIPAIITAADGSLVAVADRRIGSMADLPNSIDVVAKRSVDNGRTWSETITIAMHDGDCGYGDPSLVMDAATGDLLCIFASGAGLFPSTPEVRAEINISRSQDNGCTWSAPEAITSSIYGADCADSLSGSWYGAFAASGRSLQLRDGTIMFVIAVRKDELQAPPLANYVCASHDGGLTWRLLPAEIDGDGDEAKLAELSDGTLLMSIRNRHKGCRKYALSHDRGVSWTAPKFWDDMKDPACDGDILSYTSVVDGFSRDRLIHSIPFDSCDRRNVSVLMSYDGGQTWPVRRTIYDEPSGYSSLTVLKDGSIGILTEVGGWDTRFDICFTRITPEWLTDGADSYK